MIVYLSPIGILVEEDFLFYLNSSLSLKTEHKATAFNFHQFTCAKPWQAVTYKAICHVPLTRSLQNVGDFVHPHTVYAFLDFRPYLRF